MQFKKATQDILPSNADGIWTYGVRKDEEAPYGDLAR